MAIYVTPLTTVWTSTVQGPGPQLLAKGLEVQGPSTTLLIVVMPCPANVWPAAKA
ncbi:MAG TPA: hypothetical protein VGP33_17230 [Chloroflexota bacterium]|nr:hypothetical protein [Chloroflexota bacterium]